MDKLLDRALRESSIWLDNLKEGYWGVGLNDNGYFLGMNVSEEIVINGEYYQSPVPVLNRMKGNRFPYFFIGLRNKKYPLDTTVYYVGRPSPLGNPFRVTDESQREEACRNYHEWISTQIREQNPMVVSELSSILDSLRRGEDTVLTCYCAPKQCHSESIYRIVMNALLKEILVKFNQGK